MVICVYCGKGVVQPIVKHHNKYYHLDCYVEKDGSIVALLPESLNYFSASIVVE